MIHRSTAYILLRSCNFVLAGPVTTQVPLSASLLSDVDHQVHHPKLQHSPLRPCPPFSLGSAALAIVGLATIAHTHTKTISKFLCPSPSPSSHTNFLQHIFRNSIRAYRYSHVCWQTTSHRIHQLKLNFKTSTRQTALAGQVFTLPSNSSPRRHATSPDYHRHILTSPTPPISTQATTPSHSKDTSINDFTLPSITYTYQAKQQQQQCLATTKITSTPGPREVASSSSAAKSSANTAPAPKPSTAGNSLGSCVAMSASCTSSARAAAIPT